METTLGFNWVAEKTSLPTAAIEKQPKLNPLSTPGPSDHAKDEDNNELGTDSPGLAQYHPNAMIRPALSGFEKIPRELLKTLFCLLPKNNLLSLANWPLNRFYKDVFFFPLLSELSEVQRQIKKNVPIHAIAQTMQLESESELACYLANKILCSNTQRKTGENVNRLERLAEGGCRTAQLKVEIIFSEKNYPYHPDFRSLIDLARYSSDACCCIGLRFIKGPEQMQDFKAAKSWFEKAITLDQTNISAYLYLGDLLSGTSNIIRHCTTETAQSNLADVTDIIKARCPYRKAIELGSVSALFLLGMTYWANYRQMNDFRQAGELHKAVEYIQQATEKGYKPAKKALLGIMSRIYYGDQPWGISDYLLGLKYLNHWNDGAINILRGRDYLMDAVRRGYDSALMHLTQWYIKEKNSANPEDCANTQCLEFILTRLSKSQHPDALYRLGTMYELDPSEFSQQKAAHYFKQAVFHNRHKAAVEKIGSEMLSNAFDHLKNKDYSKAYSMYAVLAEAGLNRAKEQITLMYMSKWITQISDALFVLCFEHVASQGNTDAAYALGCFYMNMSIIKKREDLLKAKEWFEKAHKGGNTDASKQLAAVNEQLKDNWGTWLPHPTLSSAM